MIGRTLKIVWRQQTDACQLLHDLVRFVFLETKNGKTRRLPMSDAVRAVLAQCPKMSPWVFLNVRTRGRYTVNGVAHVFRRALTRAGITTGDVSLHSLRHTAISRMIATGFDDHTVKKISGHSSTRMLERYTHPTDNRMLNALDTFAVVTDGQQMGNSENGEVKNVGGRREARTRGLRVANGQPGCPARKSVLNQPRQATSLVPRLPEPANLIQLRKQPPEAVEIGIAGRCDRKPRY